MYSTERHFFLTLLVEETFLEGSGSVISIEGLSQLHILATILSLYKYNI